MFAGKHRPDAADSLRAAADAAFAAPLALIAEGQAAGRRGRRRPRGASPRWRWPPCRAWRRIANAGMLDDAALDGLVAGAVERLVLGLRPR